MPGILLPFFNIFFFYEFLDQNKTFRTVYKAKERKGRAVQQNGQLDDAYNKN